jgi:hypothetical protein
VGFLPVFFPPEGGLGHAPVHAQPGPVDAVQAVVVEQALIPPFEEDAGFDPLLEAVVGGGAGTELGGIEGLPLTARAEDKEDGLGTNAVGGTGSSSTVGMGVDMCREEQLQDFPKFIGDTPLVGNVRRVHVQSSCGMVQQPQEL